MPTTCLARSAPTIRYTVRRLARLWRCPTLTNSVTVEFSPRLTRSLGRTLPAARRVRLHAALADPRNARLLRLTLTHELAHIAARLLHGPTAKPHGPEWAALLHKARCRPTTTLAPKQFPVPTPRPRARSHIYKYRCPVCQSLYLARRKDPRLRCGRCLRTGLPGHLHLLNHE